MPAFSRLRHASFIGVGILGLFVCAGAGAQMPPPGPPGEADEIHACLCEQQQIAGLKTTIDDKENSLHEIRQQLQALDAQLESERPKVDVSNPDSVARYKALLERHDRIYQRSVGPVAIDTAGSVKRYNGRVADYNQHCAHQLFDAGLMAQVRANLVCPGPR